MSDSSAMQISMLNDYIAALERQVKSVQMERESLFQQIAKFQNLKHKQDEQLHILKNQIRDLNNILHGQSIDRANMEQDINFLAENNENLKKQLEFAETKLAQLNAAMVEKNELLAKQKNNLYLTTTYHNKIYSELQEQTKDLQKKLKISMDEKAKLNEKLAEIDMQLLKQRQTNYENSGKITSRDNKIETLKSKVQTLENDILKAHEQKQCLKGKLTQTLSRLQNSVKQCESLSQKILYGSQTNQETKKSFEEMIENIKGKYEQEISSQLTLVHSKDESIKNLNEIIDTQSLRIQNLTKIVGTKDQQIAKIMHNLKEKEQQIAVCHGKITALNDMTESLINELSQEKNKVEILGHKNNKLTQEVVEKEIEIQQLKKEISDLIKNKNLSLSDKEAQFNDLKLKFSELQSILQLKSHEAEMSHQELQEKKKLLHINTEKLQIKATELEIKTEQCEKLSREVHQLMNELHDYQKGIQHLGSQKQQESQKLKNKIIILDQELVEVRKKQARLSKSLKDTEDKLFKATEDFTSLKESSEKTNSDHKKRILELEKQLESTKQKLQQKQQNLQGLGHENQFKIKLLANQEQSVSKQLTDLQTKYTKTKAKLVQAEKQLDQKDTQHNIKIQKLIIQHKNDIKIIKKQSQQELQLKEQQYEEQILALTIKLKNKEKQITETSTQLLELKDETKTKISSNSSEIQRKNSILQVQLQSIKKQLEINTENLSALEGTIKKQKQQILQLNQKIQVQNIQIQRSKTQNAWLIDENEVLRSQIEALESSTVYLKKQIASSLEQQQKSIKEIRSLKETNREMSKMMSSTNAPIKRSRDRAQSGIILESHKSKFGGTESKIMRKSEFVPEVGSILQKKIYGSSYKRNTKVIPKYSTQSSVPSSDNAEIVNEKRNEAPQKPDEGQWTERSEVERALTDRDSIPDESEFMPPSIVSSSYYRYEGKDKQVK